MVRNSFNNAAVQSDSDNSPGNVPYLFNSTIDPTRIPHTNAWTPH